MSLAAILLIGGGGAAIAAWGMTRGGREARYAAILGCLALLAVLVLALITHATPITEAGVVPTDGWFRGTVVKTDYERLTIALWALDSVVVICIAWLMGGTAALRGLLPATLTAIAGGVVALGATDLSIGIAVAGVTGLVSLLVLRGSDRTSAVAVAARELRMVVGGAVLLLGAVAVAPVAAALVLAGTAIPTVDGSAPVLGGGAITPGEAGSVLGLVALAVTAGVAARFGAIPFHVRIPQLTDNVPPIAIPLLLAWLPLPVGVVGLAVLDALVGPLALTLDVEQAVIVGIALVTMAAGALAAYLADDIRHAVGYLVVADVGLVLLGFAALDPAAWGPTRVMLVTIAGSKTALAAFSAVAESRFGTRRISELRGWARHAPILAAGFALAALATYGLPGWIVLSARTGLAGLVAGGQWSVAFTLAGLLTIPVYLRIMVIGLGPRSSHVANAAPERVPQRRRNPAPVLDDGDPMDPAAAVEPPDAGVADAEVASAEVVQRPAIARSPVAAVAAVAADDARRGIAAVARGLLAAVRRDRTELISACVLALALLATLTAWGALDLGNAASEPAPIVSGPATD